ncbi:RNA 2',3'-cyclic phosphodiesterase [Burkholderia multivorans]|uniref:RNA 2',3'-cyclic phosphodiesterase n=1 Tax=Burkholderia multivorans TaxID=87883 RepID=UPI000CFF92B0|nr:RNA 2',3'-cyclic phosphodiesterase [Burkholderia multivorans]MBR7893255.1 RNA 2',3'-cyclic phosphodiesterase [Burkholderia multivorans]MBR8452401.1 RNA 2',3'-cyclic phosphodiesterase [Burkholderia multivorans]MBU9448373.1 RNA 2',3'-cyclic phosphodiesterase [Burkholderia multivorans]MCL4647564.1 RNA 2',3'-cyclic phosphodiesterase [Burkholderia multivorans]MDN7943571.1 RNA 2',3'-cyclic phosphodiesterase [Burkholderia multivorans]
MTQLTLPGIEAPRLHHRLFFAVQPDSDTAARIADAARRLWPDATGTGHWVDTARLHVTLHSLGEFMQVPPDVIARAREAAQRVRAEPFDVSFDRIVSFSGRSDDRPWVLTVTDVSHELIDLQRQLVEALKRTGLRPPRTSFTPHVTLRYDRSRRAPHTIEPIAWTVSEFVLIDSWLGKTHHDVIDRWPLDRTTPI